MIVWNLNHVIVWNLSHVIVCDLFMCIVLSRVFKNSLRRRRGFVGVWAVGEPCVAALVKAALGGRADRNLMFVDARLPASGSRRCKEKHKFISIYFIIASIFLSF